MIKQTVMKKLIVLPFFIPAICFAQDSITTRDIHSAEKIASIHFTELKEDSLLDQVRNRTRQYDKMHQENLDNSVPVTLAESPLLPNMHLNKKQLPVKFLMPSDVNMPANKNDLAFYSIPQLASL